MWQLAHLASGALVGQQAQSPILALALGVGTHLLIDKIPHYWPKELGKKRVYSAVDYAITIPALAWVLVSYHTNFIGMCWGIAGSLVVDIAMVGVPILYKSKLGRWHSTRQPHHTSPIYLLNDAWVIFICYLLLQK